MSVETALCLAAWAGVILVGAGVIGVMGAIFWAFDPRAVKGDSE